MQTRALTFHADPAHGWLEVDRADLETLGIVEKISRYSYHKGNRVFLEEDCDAPKYLQAAAANNWQIKTTEKHSDIHSFIRLLNPFKG